MTNNQNRTGFLDFLKSVSDWPQPEVWFDADDREIVVQWERESCGVATVVFGGEDLTLSRWSYYSNTWKGFSNGGGPKIPSYMMNTIKEIALSE